MPELTRMRSVLAVRDLESAVAYYTNVLGMNVDARVPGWAFLSRGVFRLMLGHCPDEMPASETGDHSYFVYVTVEGVDALRDELVAKGVRLMQDLADKTWGMREFGIRTPEGHRIMFGQEL